MFLAQQLNASTQHLGLMAVHYSRLAFIILMACAVSKVMSGKGSSQTMLKTDKIAKDHMTKGSAITSGSYNAWDMVAITPSDNPWSSSPMAQEV